MRRSARGNQRPQSPFRTPDWQRDVLMWDEFIRRVNSVKDHVGGAEWHHVYRKAE